jgi:hypothetical protein
MKLETLLELNAQVDELLLDSKVSSAIKGGKRVLKRVGSVLSGKDAKQASARFVGAMDKETTARQTRDYWQRRAEVGLIDRKERNYYRRVAKGAGKRFTKRQEATTAAQKAYQGAVNKRDASRVAVGAGTVAVGAGVAAATKKKESK